MLAVVATYTTFLLFAQFGFLHQLERDLGTAAAVRSTMAWMGVAGLGASVAAAMALARVGAERLIRFGLIASAAAAMASLACHEPFNLRLVAALIGGAIACTTVSLAAGLRTILTTSRVGLAAGLGTGAAYGISNLPFLFDAAPWLRASIPAALCLLSAAWPPRTVDTESSGTHPSRDADVPAFWRVLPVFLLLVWLDSAAFTFIQQASELKARSWGGETGTIVQGAVHLGAAVTAGWLLDRGRFFGLLGMTWALFAVAFPLLEHGGRLAGAGGPLYAAGISLYSVALVTYPSADGGGSRAAGWRAGVLYGIAGWLGSALGVGMARDLGHLPYGFVAVTGVIILVAWTAPGRAALLKAARLYGVTLLIAILGGIAVVRGAPRLSGREADAVARGRAVYVAEGCIQCHSQYVRPGTIDEAWWGPFRALDRDARPPLVGTRRAGPDLLNAGNRRSAVWHALHLRDPRGLSPASRMPSYAHLFERGDARGAELVAYLASLGATSSVERETLTQRAPIAAAGPTPSLSRGAELFRAYCAACHGPAGDGNGHFSAMIDDPAMNLHTGRLARGAFGAAGLARLVRFGIPGTSMPGHEYLRDEDVADLVAFVRHLPRDGAGQ